MKSILAVLLLITLQSHGQQLSIPRNIFSLGTGISSRGAIYAEHCYNFNLKRKFFVSIESAVGFNIATAAGNYSISPAINFGVKKKFVSLGIENKFLPDVYFSVVDNGWGFPFFESFHYKGYVVSPFVAFNYIGASWLNFKIRASLNILTKNYAPQVSYDNIKQIDVQPGLGISFGFFNRKSRLGDLQ